MSKPDVWGQMERMREALTDNTHISRKLLEAMLDQHKAVVAERDALVAYADRVVTAACTEGAGIRLREAIDNAPTASSLARLKAQWQAGALEEVAMDVRADYGHHTQYNVSLLAAGIEGYARAKRRQAEESN